MRERLLPPPLIYWIYLKEFVLEFLPLKEDLWNVEAACRPQYFSQSIQKHLLQTFTKEKL